MDTKNPTRQPFTPEERDTLLAKGWEVKENVAYGDGGYSKLVKSKHHGFVEFRWMDDGDGGYWDEWANDTYKTLDEVPKTD
jgi:hypothetical protein